MAPSRWLYAASAFTSVLMAFVGGANAVPIDLDIRPGTRETGNGAKGNWVAVMKRYASLAVVALGLAIAPLSEASAAFVFQSIGNLGALSAGDSAGFGTFATSGLNSNSLFNGPNSGGGDGQANLANFSVSADVVLTSSAVSINLASVFGITNFDFALLESADSFVSATIKATPLAGVLSFSGFDLSKSYALGFSGEEVPSGGLIAGSYSVVPLPPAVWLFLSALIGLVVIVRKRSAQPRSREA